MKHFKIKVGYGDNEYISIEETELEKAFAVFIADGKGIFKNGIVRGQDIIAIQEDWNKAMGYNPEHKIDGFDRAEIKRTGVEKRYKGLLTEVSRKVEYLIKNNQKHLIGQNVEIPELENTETKILSNESKKIADKFDLNK